MIKFKNVLFSVGIDIWIVCGKMICCIVWLYVILMEYVVFVCFFGIEIILLWIIFEVYVFIFNDKLIIVVIIGVNVYWLLVLFVNNLFNFGIL